MSYTADLHLHSSFARATSPRLDLPTMVRWARIKGIDLIASADFTHPTWLTSLERDLADAGDGLFTLRRGLAGDAAAGEPAPHPSTEPRVILGTEVSCVYPQNGRSHRIHLLVFAPDFGAVRLLCEAFAPHGSLRSDGRPMLRLSGRDVVAAALEADERCVVIPAHAWTPWYSVYGSKGGFDSLAECFGDMTDHIHAVETGLSSDPGMNWRVPELDGRTIVSFSDAHSPQRMGRELTMFDGDLSYDGFRSALMSSRSSGGVSYTVEFYPEEGKYHYDGHRKCGVCQHPAATLERGERCPVCGRKLTLGVLHRMEALSARPVTAARGADGMWRDPAGVRAPFRRLVPLDEVIAEAHGRGPATKGVRQTYAKLIEGVGSELHVLEAAPLDEIADAAGEHVAEGVRRARAGELDISPGYDGVYGEVRLWSG
jgi:uncharacterized protein (TIGR00375 family)